MNFIERNTKKIMLVIGLATCLTAITTVYAATEKDGWNNGVYYVDGQIKTEWLFEEDGPVYYLNEEGRATTGWKTIENDTYYFNANGERVSGQVVIDGYQYSFQANGRLLIGWQNNNTSYYNQYGVALCGDQKIDGETYHFDENGVLQTGWVEDNQGKRYFSEKGTLQTGFVTIEKAKYYFNEESGYLKTGWITVDENKYYADKDGALVSGWQTIKEKKYYFDEDTNVMATGKVEIDGEKYFFNKKGVFRTGWYTNVDGKILYYNDYGFAQKGWQTIDGEKYYFDSKGYAKVNCTYDGYEFDENGVGEKVEVQVPVYAPNSSNGGGNYNPVGNGNNATAAGIALNYLGYNYVYGGSSPSGFDCSGLVYYAYQSAGINVPRSGYSQAYMGSGVSYGNMQTGDVIIWDGGSHVSIYIGNGQMVHATNPRTGVKINSVSEWASYGQSITGIRRP